MQPIVLRDRIRNSKGVTLVEVLIALVVLLIVMMGTYQAAILAVDTNLRNLLRDEAVRIATDDMNAFRNSPFNDLVPSAIDGLGVGFDPPLPYTVPTQTRTRNLRNVVDRQFLVDTVISSLNTNMKQISITVTWEWKERTIAGGNAYTFNTISMVRQS